MSLTYWLLIGLVAGALAKMLTPQEERGGWVSSIIIGILGAWVGYRLGGLIGLTWIFGRGIIGNLVLSTLGAFLVLWIYHKFLADKLNLPL